jgi:hypothetical protein
MPFAMCPWRTDCGDHFVETTDMMGILVRPSKKRRGLLLFFGGPLIRKTCRHL